MNGLTIENQADIVRAIADLGVEIGSEDERAATVMLAMPILGTMDAALLATALGMDADEIRRWVNRLIANKIWEPPDTLNVDWFDAEDGLGFAMDLNVALGDMERCDGDRYRLTPQGIERARGLMGDET